MSDLVLSHGGKHRVAFEHCDFFVACRVQTLRKSKVDQIVSTLQVAYIVKLDIPMAEPCLVQQFQSGKNLNSHVANLCFELVALRLAIGLHVPDPFFV